MTPQKLILERAFELARSGECQSIPAIRKKLHAEGYSKVAIESIFSGRALQKQLLDLCRHSRD